MIDIDRTIKVVVPEETDNPFLQGPFRPNRLEYHVTHEDLQVWGEIPEDLDGVYVRNTHNQVQSPLAIYHPFDGDGMLHAIRFHEGRVEYRNRFVRTTGLLAEQGAGTALWPGLLQPGEYTRRGWGAMGSMKDNAGTDVNVHCGMLLASMSQGSEPWRLDPVTLETLGVDTQWARLVSDGVSAHYKVDPQTGDMVFFNYPEHPPYMNYGVIDRHNQLVHYVPIELPGARWPHDIGMTEHYSILHDLPYFFDPDGLQHGRRHLQFHRDMPARFGVIPRFGHNRDVRWFEASSAFVMHLTNCFEDGDEVVMDGCIWIDPQMPPVGESDDIYARIKRQLDKHRTRTLMYRWRFNLRTGLTKEEQLDDEVTEFPVASNDVVGYPYRYSLNTMFVPGEWLFSGLKRYDLQAATADRYEYGPQRFGSEPQIARATGATAEDDGYVVTFVTDVGEDFSECLVLRADDIAAGPIARIRLPERISVGTHGCWVEQNRIAGERQPVPAPIPAH